MLLNLTNHPFKNWDEKQIKMAESRFGNIVDIPFPQVDPEADETEINDLANHYSDKCLKILSASKDQNNALHIMGELTFCFSIVNKFQKEGIRCIASTTSRKAVQNGNFRTSEFIFCRFREYLSK